MPRPMPMLLLLATLTACARTAAPTSCQTDAQCPEASRCGGGVCTADRRPVAAVSPVGAVEAFALVQLDGSASHDPDPADAVLDHGWTVRAVEAPCAPPAIASRGPRPVVRFGCPGRYEVELAVTDPLGVASEPAKVEVTVGTPTGDPLVVTGPDLATEHACGGAPLTCRNESAIALAADADPRLSLRWSVLPPGDRPLDGTRRVRFLPSESAAEPVAIIETDGTAISGDWIFRVEAVDAYGVVGAAHTRVSVRNREPVVTFEPAGPFPHVFDPGRSAFLSSGELGWSVVDPDGDPVEIAAVWRHVGDGGAIFDGELAETTVGFAVEVPYAAPEDALLLRGGIGLSRRIEIVALDANRTVGRGAAEIAIGNRPPAWVGGDADAAAPHRFDRASSRYVATARGGRFVDPDGDPMFGAPGEGPCGTVTVDGTEATVECSVPFLGTPALDQLVGKRTFPVRVRDAWDVATTFPVQTLEILNSPPALAATTSPSTVCVALPDANPFIALVSVPATAFDVLPSPADPDGDPIVVTALVPSVGSVSPAAETVAGSDPVPFRFAQEQLGYWTSPIRSIQIPEAQQSFLVATDGAESVRLAVSPSVVLCP